MSRSVPSSSPFVGGAGEMPASGPAISPKTTSRSTRVTGPDMGTALLLLMLAFEDPPKDVAEFFRSAAVELSEAHDNGSGRAFLDDFDKSMPGYAALSDQIEAMVAAGEVSTTIDFVNTEGNDRKRTLDLDWL